MEIDPDYRLLLVRAGSLRASIARLRDQVIDPADPLAAREAAGLRLRRQEGQLARTIEAIDAARRRDPTLPYPYSEDTPSLAVLRLRLRALFTEMGRDVAHGRPTGRRESEARRLIRQIRTEEDQLALS